MLPITNWQAKQAFTREMDRNIATGGTVHLPVKSMNRSPALNKMGVCTIEKVVSVNQENHLVVDSWRTK